MAQTRGQNGFEQDDAYLNETDRWFHEQTGIRLPAPGTSAAEHRIYDQLAYGIVYGDAVPDLWSIGEDERTLVRDLGGVLGVPISLAKVF